MKTNTLADCVTENRQNDALSDCEEPMCLHRFEQIVGAYGANEALWPDDERQAALLLAKSSDEAARVLRKEASLDVLLDLPGDSQRNSDLDGALASMLSASVYERLCDDVVRKATAPPVGWREKFSRLQRWLWPFGAPWKPALALGVAVIAGLAVGFGVPVQFDDPEHQGEATVISEVAFEMAGAWDEEP